MDRSDQRRPAVVVFSFCVGSIYKLGFATNSNYDLSDMAFIKGNLVNYILIMQ